MTTLKGTKLTLSIDAVTASVEVDVQTLSDTLCGVLNATAHPCRPLRGMGYNHAAELLSGDHLGRRCVIQYGDSHSKPNVCAEGTSGYDAPAVYEALCTHFAGIWYPSRLDPALDFHDDAAFDLLARLLLDFAKKRNITIDYRGDWERGANRTLYLYSRDSQFYVRLYEYRAYHGYGPPCRLEVEIKLKGREKRARLTTLSPWELLCMCPASYMVIDTLGLDLAPIKVTQGPRPPTSNERDLAFLSSTAFPALIRLMGQYGTAAGLVGAILDYRAETERTKRLLHGESEGYTPQERTPGDSPDGKLEALH